MNHGQPTMKICPQCKTQNSESARFCIGCSNYLMSEPRKCPNGHTMDSTWTECAYCNNQGGPASPGATPSGEVEPAVAVAASRVVPPPLTQSGLSARNSDPGPYTPPPPPNAAPTKRRMTQFAPGSLTTQPTPGEPAPSAKEPERRIVGVLVTYTWKPDGQLFPVREGRNLIGRDPEQCEIAIPQDMTLSSINSHITYRKSFVAGDMVSMSGTDVNGEPIEQQFRALPNYATLRTGSTYWTFIRIAPGPEGSES